MQYFKDAQNKIFAYENDVTEFPDGLTELTEAEISAVLNPPPPAPDANDVISERSRRLSAGFTYDFGDERGTHLIGTTREDHAGWDEVTKLATAAVLGGAPNTAINIKTETGTVSVTASEWQSIVISIGQWAQPIWQASFALQAMDPIPEDYNDDKWWP